MQIKMFNNRINNNKTITSKSFELRAKLIGNTLDDDNVWDAEIVIPLNYLSNFWRSLTLPLINCEIEIDLAWSKECTISEISLMPRIPGNPDANPPVQEVSTIQKTPAKFHKEC